MNLAYSHLTLNDRDGLNNDHHVISTITISAVVIMVIVNNNNNKIMLIKMHVIEDYGCINYHFQCQYELFNILRTFFDLIRY